MPNFNIYIMITSSPDWAAITASLHQNGHALLPQYWSAEECAALAGSYSEDGLYRSTINMERYRFGRGQYRYFSYPLPAPVQAIRETFYPHLAVVANDWMSKLGIPTVFPSHHSEFVQQCHAHHQVRPTCLTLRYEKGGFNTLHQDLYGDIYFPFQVLVVLSRKDTDYKGGEFVMVEQLPRAQSRAQVLQPEQGDAIIFTTNFRPVQGSRGYYRSKMKHGISAVTQGTRHALGIIFHDAV